MSRHISKSELCQKLGFSSTTLRRRLKDHWEKLEEKGIKRETRLLSPMQQAYIEALLNGNPT